jgi:hypothetical protein
MTAPGQAPDSRATPSLRHSGLDPESRVTPSVRHSGLDPGSSPGQAPESRGFLLVVLDSGVRRNDKLMLIANQEK